MRIPLLITLTLALTTACSADNKTSASTDDSSTGANTDANTTSPTSSGASESASSSGGEPNIVAESTDQVCEGQPGALLPDQLHTPPLAAPALTATALGAGEVAVKETEHAENCGYTLTAVPELSDANTITLTYQTMGEIADCECSFTIDVKLSGLTPGSWTIKSGALEATVDVT